MNRRALVSDVPRHGHALRPDLPHAKGIWHHSVPLLIIGLRIVRLFEHLVASHDGFAQLFHVRPQSATGIPPEDIIGDLPAAGEVLESAAKRYEIFRKYSGEEMSYQD